MNDDMSYYNFEELNTYKTKCVKNILLYVIYVMLFVLTNIIIYFINNDVLYGVLVSIVWILFLNFSIIYFEKTFNKNRRIYNLYKKLFFGNKKQVQLIYVGRSDDVINQSLTFSQHIFKDRDGKIKKTLLIKEVEVTFTVDKCYELLMINDLIYGGVLIHD